MKLQALTDTGLLMASTFLSISCVYMLLMLGILPRLQGQGTGERVLMVYPCDSVMVGLTDRHHTSYSFTIKLAHRMVYLDCLQTRLRVTDPFRSF